MGLLCQVSLRKVMQRPLRPWRSYWWFIWSTLQFRTILQWMQHMESKLGLPCQASLRKLLERPLSPWRSLLQGLRFLCKTESWGGASRGLTNLVLKPLLTLHSLLSMVLTLHSLKWNHLAMVAVAPAEAPRSWKRICTRHQFYTLTKCKAWFQCSTRQFGAVKYSAMSPVESI